MPTTATKEETAETPGQNERESQEQGDSNSDSSRSANSNPHTPPAEWAVAGLGLALVLGAVGYELNEGMNGEARPPAITVKQSEVRKIPAGYLVRIEVENSGEDAVAGLLVEGELQQVGSAPEISEATFDYVPRGSKRSGGLFFQGNPRQGSLTLRAKGYQEP